MVIKEIRFNECVSVVFTSETFLLYFRSSPVPGSLPWPWRLAAAVAAHHVDYLFISSVIDSQTANPKESCFVSVLVDAGAECRRFRWGRRGQSSGQIWSLFSQRGERKRGLPQKGALHPSSSSCSYSTENNASHTSSLASVLPSVWSELQFTVCIGERVRVRLLLKRALV